LHRFSQPLSPSLNPLCANKMRLLSAGAAFLLAVDQKSASEKSIRADEIKEQFAAFVSAAAYPCLGAKAAFNGNSHVVSVLPSFASLDSSVQLAEELDKFVQSDLSREDTYATFVAIFREPRSLDEEGFERLLWRQLQELHRIDSLRHEWDKAVSSDPDDAHFSFSFGGQALYVVGLHAHSSRMARRFSWPALVFNPHEQFERLRHDGKWRRMQATIRSRDVALQGNINPMLSDFGEQSEARQYSGREVDENWRPPFRPVTSSNENKSSVSRCPFAH
jgi:uncharacterized protein